MAPLKRATNVIFWSIMVLLATGAILIIASSLHLIPYQFLYVESDSMIPVFAKGDIVLIRTLDKNEEANVNEIVSFTLNASARAIHRVYSKVDGCITTKGDNVDHPDPGGCKHPLGKFIFSIPKVGWFFMGFQRGIDIIFFRKY